MVSTAALKAKPYRFNLNRILDVFPKTLPLHPFSLRFSLGLWAGSSLAFYLAFLFQFETPQWAGVSVWIMFMQSPRLNYSKVLFWMAGTLSGAVVATLLIICFAQTPEIFLLLLSSWLAICAALATQLREYRAYGAVLAGYTAAIVSFTAVNDPQQIFEIAVARVSCVTLGIACAILAMTIFLPKHLHWKQTLHHLRDHCRRVLQQATMALRPDQDRSGMSSWEHVVERLSILEHTFDFTLAESADSRTRSAQTRSLTATLFCLAAKAQAVEFHLSHAKGSHSREVRECQKKVSALTEKSWTEAGPDNDILLIGVLVACRAEIENLQAADEKESGIPDRFLLDQLNGILLDLEHVVRDRAGLVGTWSAPRSSCLTLHRDPLMGALYALRIFLAMGLGTGFWFATEWPSGSSFLLFLAIVCSLLSLLDHAEHLGRAFLKSVAACFVAAFIELFWILQKGEGFPFICLALGLFLVPAAYAYTHPRLAGSAVISMLLFYGLVAPANPMIYDIGVFLNNAVAFLAAAAFGFFAFHVVGSPSPALRRKMLLRTMMTNFKHVADWRGPLREQRWVSLAFDRLRLLHRFGSESAQSQMRNQEELLHLGLLWGLRQIGLHKFMERRQGGPEAIGAIKHLLNISRRPFPHSASVISKLRQTKTELENLRVQGNVDDRKAVAGVLGELQEMSFLLQAMEVART